MINRVLLKQTVAACKGSAGKNYVPLFSKSEWLGGVSSIVVFLFTNRGQTREKISVLLLGVL